MSRNGWNVIDADAGVLWREYPFRKGALATTLVFRGTDGGLVVVSPGIGLVDRDYDELREFGEVRALIANNPFHNLGQKPWRERFKDAQSYAPPGAVQALNKRVPGVPFRSLAELPLPASVRWEDPPGFRSGEAILSVGTKRGSVFYAGDLLADITEMPPPPVRWLFSLSGSAPGFRLFKLVAWCFVKDRKALKEWSLRRIAEDPPAIVVPAHGRPVETPDVAEQTRAQLLRL
jgi:hypothetical protein